MTIDPLDAIDAIDVVLDTDIGSDVDDVLAIAALLGSPELRLTAVTTVYGDVRLRARMVRRTLHAAGVDDVPVVPGAAGTRSGRPVWWAGHEGSTMPDLDDEIVDDGDVRALLSTAPTVAAIGPLTNLADAVEGDPRPGRIVMMGGSLGDLVEHNIRCDVDAADVVTRSGVPMTMVGLDQTARTAVDRRLLDRLGEQTPLAALLTAEVRTYWRITGRDANTPHDPVAVLALARPDLFTFARGRVEVLTDGADPGRTVFTADADGPHDIAVDLDVDRIVAEIEDRIIRAAAPDRAPVEEVVR